MKRSGGNHNSNHSGGHARGSMLYTCEHTASGGGFYQILPSYSRKPAQTQRTQGTGPTKSQRQWQSQPGNLSALPTSPRSTATPWLGEFREGPWNEKESKSFKEETASEGWKALTAEEGRGQQHRAKPRTSASKTPPLSFGLRALAQLVEGWAKCWVFVFVFLKSKFKATAMIIFHFIYSFPTNYF